MILKNLFLIALVLVLTIDISGAMADAKLLLSKLLTKQQISTADYRLKPFDCSFCMTFWVGLLYIAIAQQFTLVNIALTLLMAYATPIIHQLLLLIKDLLLKLIDTIYDKVV